MRNLVTALVTLLVCPPGLVHGNDKPQKLPNIVFILADDLGWADISPYGSKFHETPNLQRFADQAVRFTDFYTASPLCSPTRSSILTGLYPARTGITAPVCHLPEVQLKKKLMPGNPKQEVLVADSVTRLLSRYVTLAEILRALGYRTAHFGKWHLGHGAGYEPKDQGFDEDIPYTPRAAGPGSGYLAPWKFVGEPKYQGRPGEHIDEWMAGQAEKFIQANKDRPFFINFWLYSVHSPWNANKSLVEEFAKKADPKAAQRNPLYAAMVKGMDNAVGRLLEGLKSARVADNTIVIFTSDNGGYAYLAKTSDPAGFTLIPMTSNFPLRSGKASNYQGGTRVPCLIAWPGKTRPGSTSPALFSSVDFLPTLLEMTGAKIKDMPQHDGISQMPALLDGKGPREAVYVHFPHGSAAQDKQIDGFWPGTSVRKGPWRLIRFFARNDDISDRLELYNVQEDIGETKNLAPEKKEVIQELSGLIDDFLKDTGAVIPKANPQYKKAYAEWTFSKDTVLEDKAGQFQIRSTGKDPWIATRNLPPLAQGPFTVKLRIKSNAFGPGVVYYSDKAQGKFSLEQTEVFPLKHDGIFHDYEVKVPAQKLTGLRLDPGNAPGEILISHFSLLDAKGVEIRCWVGNPMTKFNKERL